MLLMIGAAGQQNFAVFDDNSRAYFNSFHYRGSFLFLNGVDIPRFS
jgi:hypothetical protein